MNDWEAPLPRVGLAVRSDGLWADHVCEAPYEQWTVANETYAVALDDPADALGRAFGMSAPMAFDLEWYATSAPTAVRDGYEQQGEVHGVVELGGGALELQAAPAHRTHRWADALAPWTPEPAVAHLGLRAVARRAGRDRRRPGPHRRRLALACATLPVSRASGRGAGGRA